MKYAVFLALLLVAQAPPAQLDPPVPPSALNGPPWDPAQPFGTPESYGALFTMLVSPTVPAWFTPEQLGRPLESFDRIECYGRLEPGALLRYFVNGTMPTALEGAVIPINPPPPAYPTGPERTIDGPESLFIYTPALLRGFKVIAVSTATRIEWRCMRGI